MSGKRGEEVLSIGQVLRPQGLKGQVKVRPDTDDPGRYLLLEKVLLSDAQGAYLEIDVHEVTLRGGFVYLKLGSDESVEDAGARRGCKLYVRRGEAAPLAENENYVSDLIDCRVVDTSGNMIGVVEDILQLGGCDVYVVKTPQGKLMFPALRRVILLVDVDAGLITADAETLAEVSVLED